MEVENIALNLIKKLIKDRNYILRFNSNVRDKENKEVNALIKKENNKVIIEININSIKTIEFLVIHEITHDIVTKDMRDLIYNYSKKDNKFKNKLNTLKERYNTNSISEEVIADICGKLLGNKEFIKSVIERNPNIFYKELNKKYILEEYVSFIKKLSTIWLDAYYSSESNLNETKFSIKKDSNGNKYVEVDTDQDIFIGKSISEQNKIAKQYILEVFREKGLIKDGKRINVNNKTASKYTNPKEPIPKYNKSVKNKISTELDNLIEISTKIAEKDDKKSHAFAKDGWEYYQVTFKIERAFFTAILNIGKSNKEKTLYDITNIKKDALNGELGEPSVILKKSSSSANNIPRSKTPVK